MNARVVVVWSAAALTVDLATNDPVYRATLLLVCVDVLLALVPPSRSLRPLITVVVVIGVLAVGLNLALSHTGTHVLVEMPVDWPLLGGPITLEAAAYGLAAGLGIAGAVFAVAPISLVLETHELVDALPRGLERSALVVASALNLAPAIGRSAVAIRDAETMRGWRPRGPRSWAEILVPTMLGAIEDSLGLAEAMESRAFGSGPRTRYAPGRWNRGDALVVVAAIAAAGCFIVGRIAGASLDWRPYPTLVAPAVEPVLIGAILLLAAPLIGRRWSASTI
ncbi:MAG: energy-coupling factor transporter transmembrane protein EcfT [Chloroflexi bacterium]|nr:energy-coupling factor transporter transmembrane protein EcfT [Chloroflexota bacterium]